MPILSNTIYSSQDTEPTYVSINRWMDKEDMVYTYTSNGILLGHERIEILPFLAT